MGTVTRYVNSDSTAGGNGTTNATTGANRAYASLSEWEAAEATDLVTDGDSHICEVNGTSADGGSRCELLTWTTDATHTLIVRMLSGSEHGGVWNTGTHRLVISDTYDGAFEIGVGAEFCTLQGLQLENQGSLASQSRAIRITATSAISDIKVLKNIARLTGTGTPGTESDGIQIEGDANCVVANNLVLTPNGCEAGIYVKYLDASLGDISVYHNTVIGGNVSGEVGIESAGADTGTNCRFFNNLVALSETCYSLGDANLTTGNNVGDDASSPDGASYQNRTFTFAGGSDYHLDLGDSGAADLGANLTSDSFYAVIDDVDGDSRATTPDCGFDEIAGLVITSVGGDDQFESGEQNVVIAGSGFSYP